MKFAVVDIKLQGHSWSLEAILRSNGFIITFNCKHTCWIHRFRTTTTWSKVENILYPTLYWPLSFRVIPSEFQNTV